MALNPAYEDIGKGFVSQYYLFFDDPNERSKLVNLYNVSICYEDLNSLAFKSIYKDLVN